jgi:Flp pilus assembly protein TadG
LQGTALARDEEGQALIELALSLIALLTLMFCFMQLSLILYSRNMIADMAREGTRYASVHGASCPTTANPTCEATAAQVNSYVTSNALPNLAGGTIVVATSYASAGSSTFTTNGCESVGCSVKVKVTYNITFAMPLVPKNTFAMSSTSVAVITQ